MAHTALSDDETKEYFDSPEELDRKVTLLAQWVSKSKHMIAFTGAGISTAAGIPDFRSGMDTSLETANCLKFSHLAGPPGSPGPGKWELQAHKQARPSKCRTTDITKAIPTVTHMTLVKLHEEGLLRCVVSQNVDGLHRRSGLAKDGALYELHGNSYVEKCVSCKREYVRDYRVRKKGKQHRHFTGNVCDNPKCKGKLKDTIINFGQDLPEDTLEAGFEHARKADLCLAMGSSLTVTPAADIPETVGERDQRLVIVNLQCTPLDAVAKLIIHAKTDDVSRLLMAKLGLQIPEFKLKRKVTFICEGKARQGVTKVLVQGADHEGHPFSFIKEVTFTVAGRVHHSREEPFTFLQRWTEGRQACVTCTVVVSFHCHYGEPPLQQEVAVHRGKDSSLTLDLEYSPGSHNWDTAPSPVDMVCRKLQAAKV